MIIDFHSHDFPDTITPRVMATMCRQTEGVLWPSGDFDDVDELMCRPCRAHAIER